MDKNRQAFPMGYHRDGNSADHQGMTLRQYYAGQALIAIFAGDIRSEGLPQYEKVAEVCFKIADAMLADEGKTQ